MVWQILCFAFLGALAFREVYLDYRSQGFAGARSGLMLGFGLYYGLIPVLLYLLGPVYAGNPRNRYFMAVIHQALEMPTAYTIHALLLIVLGFLFYKAGSVQPQVGAGQGVFDRHNPLHQAAFAQGFNPRLLLVFLGSLTLTLAFARIAPARPGILQPLVYQLTALLFFTLMYLKDIMLFSAVGGLPASHPPDVAQKAAFERGLRRIAYVCLAIGTVSVIGFIAGFGSVGDMLTAAQSMRGFSSEVADFMDPTLALFGLPANLILVATFLFFHRILQRFTWADAAAFAVSAVLSVLFLLARAGRTRIVILLFAFGYVLLRKFTKRPWVVIGVLALVALPMLDVLDRVFVYFQTGEWKALNVSLVTYANNIRQFSHPLRIVVNAPDIVARYGLLNFKNLLTDIIDLLPRVQLDASFLNTAEFIMGEDWRSIGGIPNDLLSYGYLNYSWLGTAMLMYLLGRATTRIDCNLAAFLDWRTVHFMGISLAASLYAVLPNADLSSKLFNDHLLLALMLIFLLPATLTWLGDRKAVLSRAGAKP